jgi:hypothetical protein
MKNIATIINNSSYLSKLNTEEWKRFSRSTRDQRNFCECCKLGDRQLQVHHLFYDPSRELWEYTNEEVVVLCDSCHREIHEQLKKFRLYIFRYLTPNLFKILNGCLAVGLTKYEPLIFLHALAEFTGNEALVNNHAKAYGFKTGLSNKQCGH